MNPIVSVWMITYNHEKYIAQALESVLSQKTNFQFEIVIGEDCSTDNTKAILKEYEDKYPEIIKAIYHKENVGAYRNAYEFTFPICKAKYIACLEGDDYWTDVNKLQKQVDFLEANPEFSFCFHNAYVHDDDTNTEYLFNDDKGTFFKKGLNSDRVVEGWELLNEWICPTASIVFRNSCPLDYSLFEKTKYGDIVLILTLAKYGKVFYFNQVSAGYRKLLTGQRKVYSYDLPGKIVHHELLIENFKDIPYLESVCSKLLSSFTYSHAVVALRKNGIKDFRKNISVFIRYFAKVLKLKSPVNKLWFLSYIFYANSRVTAKVAINYKIEPSSH